MNIKLILPKNAVFVELSDKIFFLAGPILGGGDWQSDAIHLLAKQAPGSYVACPCRHKPEHPLYRFSILGETNKRWTSRGLELFLSQTLWERYYLGLAGKQGAIVFWLSEEDLINPRPRETGPYARDTYGELGEWRARIFYDNARVVIGAEDGFPGLSVVVKNYRAMVGDTFVFHKTLQDTIDAAVALANSK